MAVACGIIGVGKAVRPRSASRKGRDPTSLVHLLLIRLAELDEDPPPFGHPARPDRFLEAAVRIQHPLPELAARLVLQRAGRRIPAVPEPHDEKGPGRLIRQLAALLLL